MRIAQFGVFELDVAAQELRKAGARIGLQQQPFQVLTFLVERAGEIVTREELRARVWPANTFVEFDQSLNTAVKKIRTALNDPAITPRFVETLPRRGYRFIAPVQRIESQQASASPLSSAPEPAHIPATISSDRRHHSRFWFVAGWAFVALMGAFTLGWRFYHAGSSTAIGPQAHLNPLPLTSYVGTEIHPSFSPDGNQIAFSWNGGNQENYSIYVKLVGAGQPLRLTQDPADDFSPAWSPNAQWIAFVRRSPGQPSGVFVVSALGGPARRIGEMRGRSAPRVPGFQDAFFFDPGPYLCWSADSKFLVLPDQPASTEPFGLFSVSVESGERRRLTSATLRDTQPSLSPDGRTLAFVRGAGVGVSEIYLLPVSEGMSPNGEVRRLTFQEQVIQGPAWSRDGLSILFAAGRMTGPRGLWRISVSAPGKVKPLPLPADVISSPTVAQGLPRLAYSHEAVDYNIWRMKLPAGDGEAGPAHPLISSTYTEKQPQFSPDGKRITFGSNRSGTEEIWVSDADGSNAVALTSFRGVATGAPRWSPDGRQIVFDAFPDGSGEIFAVPSGGGAVERLTNDHHSDRQPSWSHDGRWIYFYSDRSGRTEVWKMPAPGAARGPAIQITRNGSGGASVFESADGKLVYYIKDNSLWSVPPDGGEPAKVLGSIEGGGGYALASEGIYFLTKGDAGHETALKFRRFGEGGIRRIASFRKHVNHLAVSPDGQWIVYVQRDHEGADLMLLENFQ